MCKIVYLTSRLFDAPSKEFKNALSKELKRRNIEVITDTTCKFKCLFRKHRTFGIAIALDFFRDKKAGCSLTLNKQCSFISRDFAYNLSNNLDLLTPRIRWRDFKFVDSYDKDWYKFFNKVSSSTKAIFYLCTYDNPSDFNNYYLAFDKIIQAFADEIVRCLRSDYNYEDYQRRVRMSKLKNNKTKK